MSEWKIYSKTGEVKGTVHKVEYSGVYMGERYITVSQTSEEPIKFEVGDYLTYRGEQYVINYMPPAEKVAKRKRYGEAFKYEDFKMNSVADELTRCDFLDYVLSDNQIHYTGLSNFSFYAGSVSDLADRLQANLDRLYKGTEKWTVRVAYGCTSPDKNISVSQQNCFEALTLVNTEFYLDYTIKGRIITIGAEAVEVNHVFSQGKGDGLFSIKQSTDADTKVITRMRAFGSTKNLPYRYYNKHGLSESQYCPNLMLPDYIENGQDTYIDADGYQNGGGYNIDDDKIRLYGIREGTVYFDGSVDLFGTGEDNDIYPTIEYMTYEQVKAAGVDITQQPGDNGLLNQLYGAENPDDDGLIPTDGTSIPSTFKLMLKDFGADLSEREDGAYKLASTDGTMTISMKSGMCQGREFEIVENGIRKVQMDGYVYYELTCNRVEDLSYYYPNNTYIVNPGDEFVIINIQMPDVYVQAAEQRLLETAKLYLPEVYETKFNYAPVIDEKFMKEHPEIADSLVEGMRFKFSDDDLGIAASVTIASLTIKEGDGLIPTYEVTLNDDVEASTIDKITAQVDKIAGAIGLGGSGASTSQINSIIQSVGSMLFLSKTKNDRTEYNLNIGGELTAEGKTQFGKQFVTGMVGGVGGQIDENAHAELQSLTLREFLEVPELRFNRIDVVSGELWNSIAFGLIESVDEERQIAKIKLEEGEMCSLQVSDICRGIFSNLGEGEQSEEVDECGFNMVYGFSTCYFTPTEITKNEAGNFEFRYALRAGSPHPSVSMKFAVYGNFTDSSRQASAYATRTYKRYLSGVNTWILDPDKNIVAQYGKLDGLQIGTMKMTGYGSFQSNAYFKGVIIQFTPEQLANLKGESAYSVILNNEEAVIKVDENGNFDLTQSVNVTAMGENVTAEGENVIVRENYISTRVQAFKGAEEMFYSPVYAEGAYTITLKCVGCEASVVNGVIVVTSVTDTSAYVDISVSCEGNATFEKRFSISAVKDGTSVSVKETVVSYAVSETSERPDDSLFTEDMPKVKDGWYLWTRTYVLYTDGKSTCTYTFTKNGTTGESPVMYSLSPTNIPLSKSMTGSISPSSFTMGLYKTVGNDLMKVEGEWKVECSTDGKTWEVYSENNYKVSSDKTEITVTNISTLYTFYRIVASVAGQDIYGYASSTTDGASGVGIAYINEYYAISADSETAPKEFTTSVVSPTKDNPYLWNYEEIVYTDGTTTTTSKHVIGHFGEDGNGIEDLKEYYLATSLSEGVTIETEGWTTKVQDVTEENPYLWNYEVVYYTNGTSTTILPHIIGHYGKDGSKGATGSMPRYNGEWSEDEVYIYNEEYCDLVIYDGNAYKMKAFCSVSTGDIPSDSDKWEQASKYSFVAMDTALIDGANIAGFMFKDGLIVSQDTTEEDGEEVRNITIDGKTGEITAYSKITAYDLEARGSLLVGDEDGKNITISKDSKDIQIHDENGNTVNTLTGESYEDAEVLPSESTTSIPITKYVNRTIIKDALSKNEDGEAIYILANGINVADGGKLSVAISDFYPSVTYTKSASGDATNPYASMVLRLVNEGTGIVIQRSSEATAYKKADNSTEGDFSGTALNTSYTWSVTEGTYRLEIYFKVIYFAAITCRATASYSVTASFEGDLYKSVHFANGFVISRSMDNLLAAILRSDSSNKLLFEAVSGGVGLKLSEDGLQLRHSGGSGFVKMPVLLYKARVVCTGKSGNGTYSITYDYRFDGKTDTNTPSASSRGIVSVTLPSLCPTLTDKDIIHAIGAPNLGETDSNGTVYVTLGSVSGKVLTFYVSDDDSTNHASFLFDIWKIV